MIAIIGLCVPEITKAQDLAGSEGSTDEGASVGSRKIHGIMRISGSCRRGFTTFGGITFKPEGDSSKVPEMTLFGSFGMPVGKNQITSFGLTYIVYPMKNRAVGKFLGFGFDIGYYYECKVNASSLLKLRAPVTDIIKDMGANWNTRYWVITPLIEFSVPIGERVRIGSKVNLPLALWDFFPQSKGYSHAKQWYDLDNFLYFSYKFGNNSTE